MGAWFEVVGLVLGVLVLAAGPLLALAGRRRLLARQGAAFECSVRLPSRGAGQGWTLGMARYHAERLEWYRFFSYALRPRLSLLRCSLRVLSSRTPSAEESTVLYADQRVVVVEEHDADGGSREWELAMHPDAVTGLLSWLEAAPPGVRRR